MTSTGTGTSEPSQHTGVAGLGDLPVGLAAGWLVGYLLLCVLIGIGAGVLWERITDLPGYTVAQNGTATTTERGLAGFISGDASFAAIGFFVSIGLGIIAWKWFGRLGWPVVIVAIVGPICAALVCWWVGYKLGPGDFDPRLAAARPGDFVPITLTVRTPVALLVWTFGALIPVLLRASLGRDPEESSLPRRGRRRTDPNGPTDPIDLTGPTGPGSQEAASGGPADGAGS
ncbi:hypothetical protein GCM10011575_11470 [Microlunatus endophyticus]|uniref:DUF2567 domain-containing protein n=1 Tax=Microlunatus endophyticus TaxID=1716077 RepID=A0A917S4T8_9ACTN|nr:hypothetical protein [Microlunatus endophyticus]GGL54805.1 hypothetical protein GCM10011575_11470 [Microlunatus endophyticus]